VLNAESEEGILHGIIVASSEVSSISYLLSASNIFEDIRANWEDKIQSRDQILPTEDTETSTSHVQTDIPVSL
jgi:hypothetical protein